MYILLPFFLFTALVSGHARLKYPPPIDAPPTDPSGNAYNSPLAADGSDFPCKNKHKSVTPQTAATTWAAGSEVNFEIVPNGPGGGEGSMAAHSGGSCQASVSFDNGATWKTVHTFQGGCPRGVALNSNIGGPDQRFKFTLPASARSGRALFGWTWVAVTGNRDEFYMNCAVIDITGSGTSTLNDLPDMFVGDLTLQGQIPPGACRSTAGNALQYPNPGSALTVEEVKGIPFKLPTPGQCFAKGSGGGGGSGGGPTSSGGSGAGPTSSGGSGGGPTSSGGAVYVPTSKGTAGLPGTTSTSKSTTNTVPNNPNYPNNPNNPNNPSKSTTSTVPNNPNNTNSPNVPNVPNVPTTSPTTTTYPANTNADTHTTKSPSTKPLTAGPGESTGCRTTFQTVVVPSASSDGY